MQRSISDRAGNIAAFAIVIAVNWMANALPLFGNTTGAISDKYYSMFTPAGFTFAIWGLIYLLLLAFIVYQALPSQREDDALARIGPWFKASCAANALWIVAWHLEWLTVSVLVMLALLVALVRIYRRLQGQDWYVRAPFSIYLAWICVATLANISALQTALGWNEVLFDETSWTLMKLSVAGAVAAVAGLRNADPLFLLTIGWAAFGIAEGQFLVRSVAGAANTLSNMAVLLAAYAGWLSFRQARAGATHD